jgi:hypothetical protein
MIHRWKWGTRSGRFVRESVMHIGLRFLKAGRRLLKWSGGRCSWCGANCGFNSTVSRKGLRCVTLDRDCTRYE